MDRSSRKTDIPVEFLEKLKRIYPQEFTRIQESFCSDKKHFFRINYLKTTLDLLRERLGEENIRADELLWPPGSFILQSGFRQLQESTVYKEGLIYVQNLSSMLPALVLRPHGSEKILDLCAAPGAKTAQIACLAGRETELVAIEKIRNRYYKLQSTLRSQGADFVRTILMDGMRAGRKFPAYFDKILLDAPCSCEARFHEQEPASFKYWSIRKVREMSYKQKKLLFSAVSCLKENGELIYATCTFSPEENEEVIDWALRECGNIEILPIDLPGLPFVGGLEAWEEARYSSQIKFTARIIPDGLWEGFFIARLKKSYS